MPGGFNVKVSFARGFRQTCHFTGHPFSPAWERVGVRGNFTSDLIGVRIPTKSGLSHRGRGTLRMVVSQKTFYPRFSFLNCPYARAQ